MYSVDEYRERYSHSNTEDLVSLLAIDPDKLTPEARTALTDELERRGLQPTQSAVPVVQPNVPVDVRERYAKAPFSDRLGAFLIDCLIGLGPVILAGLVGLLIDLGKPSKTTMAINILGASAWGLYYGLTKDGGGRGQSIGKKKLDLMVVNVKTDLPCTMLQSVGRALVLGLLCVIPVFGWLIEPFSILVSSRGRRLGDYAAGTQVIRVSAYEAMVHTRK
jgi:uncharacterized RDD family membrane protein YckC